MLNLGPLKSFLFTSYISHNENPPITDEICWSLDIRYCGASLYLIISLKYTVRGFYFTSLSTCSCCCGSQTRTIFFLDVMTSMELMNTSLAMAMPWIHYRMKASPAGQLDASKMAKCATTNFFHSSNSHFHWFSVFQIQFRSRPHRSIGTDFFFSSYHIFLLLMLKETNTDKQTDR